MIDRSTPEGAAPARAAEARRTPTGYFLVLVLVNLMWAFQFSGAKLATERLGPVTVTFLPMAISTLLFAPVVFLRRKRRAGAVGLKSRVRRAVPFLIAGTCGVLGSQLGLTTGVQHSLASNASVLTLTIPVLTAIMAVFLLGEKMSALRWLSFALAIAGVLLVSDIDWHSVALFRGTYLVGNLLILWSCLGSAFYNTYSKKLLETYSPTEVLVYSFLVTDIVLAILIAVFEPGSWRQLGGLGTPVWLTLAAIGFFSLSSSMILFFWVIQRIDVTQASLSIYLMPVFGVSIATIMVREKPTLTLLIGGTLVFISTFLVTTYEERKKSRSKD